MKTTEEQFEIFSSEISRLLIKWGLIAWEPTKRHKHIDDETIAQTLAEPMERIVVFTLNNSWKGTEETPNIPEIALHEVLELLLWKLRALVPDHRDAEAREEVHAIIQTLINVIGD